MSENIINPFKQTKKTDWAKKTQERLVKAKDKVEEEPVEVAPKRVERPKKVKKERVAKSFKIYPGNIGRDFDKRVNKLQVSFDDLDYDKEYVDSGKYIMFLMSFAEKYKLYDLYAEVSESGDLEIEHSKIVNHFGKVLK